MYCTDLSHKQASIVEAKHEAHSCARQLEDFAKMVKK